MKEDKMKELEFIARRAQRILHNEDNFNTAISIVLRNDLQSMIDLVLAMALAIEKSDDKKTLSPLDSNFN